ncbi:hypothetical protein G4B88_010953 [Cannabis sativa]|uniref:Uncharacterized protein n=1 Tax=Cannabis sativa TaxID=3483 RepID=A0A7J6HLE5_CANSA|nr:hypothetical protein G4B88_010953 [Cannabis sativa]
MILFNHSRINSISISVYWHRFFQLTTTEPKSVDESYGMFRNNYFNTDSKEEARNPQEGEEAEYSNILCKDEMEEERDKRKRKRKKLDSVSVTQTARPCPTTPPLTWLLDNH